MVLMVLTSSGTSVLGFPPNICCRIMDMSGDEVSSGDAPDGRSLRHDPKNRSREAAALLRRAGGYGIRSDNGSGHMSTLVSACSWSQCIVGVVETRASSPESLGTDPGCRINDPSLDESMRRSNKHGLNGWMRSTLVIGSCDHICLSTSRAGLIRGEGPR